MAKYALSFTTQGNDLNTYYLAASVLGMVAAKNGSSKLPVSSAGGFPNATYAKEFQGLIDDVINSKYWTTSVKCYPAAKVLLPAALSDNATKTATSVASASNSSSSGYAISGINVWLSPTSSSSSVWTAVVRQSVPYINYKISCMSETDYKAFVAAVIKAGGLSDYEQTNTPVQA